MLAAAMLAAGWGCATYPQTDPSLSRPVDFAIDFRVEGPGKADQPLTMPSRYLLEANRRLRVVLGPSASRGRYGESSRVLAPDDADRLYRHVRRHDLMSSPTREPSLPEEAVYHVTLSANEKTHAYRTTAAESPATAKLLVMLVQLHRRYFDKEAFTPPEGWPGARRDPGRIPATASPPDPKLR